MELMGHCDMRRHEKRCIKNPVIAEKSAEEEVSAPCTSVAEDLCIGFVCWCVCMCARLCVCRCECVCACVRARALMHSQKAAKQKQEAKQKAEKRN